MTPVEIPINEMNSFDLPPVCIVTGATEGVVWKPVKFAWYPRWVGLFAPFILILAAILAAILTRRAKGELPFTEEAWSNWRRGKLAMGFSVIGALAMFIGSMVCFAQNQGVAGFALLVMTIAEPVALWIALARNRGPTVDRITKTHLRLKLPSAQAAEAIALHLVAGAGRADVAPVANLVA